MISRFKKIITVMPRNKKPARKLVQEEELLVEDPEGNRLRLHLKGNHRLRIVLQHQRRRRSRKKKRQKIAPLLLTEEQEEGLADWLKSNEFL